MEKSKNYKILDAHCDTLTYLNENKIDLFNSNGMVNGINMEKYKAYLQVFACFIDDRENFAFEKVKRYAKLYDSEMKKCDYVVVKSKNDVEKVFSENRVGGLLALENGKGIGSNTENLSVLYELGYRMVTLTWNGQNLLGGGVDTNIGLTEFGKKIILKMQKLNMIIDLSHISRRGFWESLDIIDKPFILSHSNANSVCKHKRNLTDSQIKEVIKRKGVIGINFYPDFINGKKSAKLDELILHALHILDIGGENSIGIGSDFDGIAHTVSGLENNGALCYFLEKLSGYGVNQSTIDKISYKNFVRVFCDILHDAC